MDCRVEPCNDCGVFGRLALFSGVEILESNTVLILRKRAALSRRMATKPGFRCPSFETDLAVLLKMRILLIPPCLQYPVMSWLDHGIHAVSSPKAPWFNGD